MDVPTAHSHFGHNEYAVHDPSSTFAPELSQGPTQSTVLYQPSTSLLQLNRGCNEDNPHSVSFVASEDASGRPKQYDPYNAPTISTPLDVRTAETYPFHYPSTTSMVPLNHNCKQSSAHFPRFTTCSQVNHDCNRDVMHDAPFTTSEDVRQTSSQPAALYTSSTSFPQVNGGHLNDITHHLPSASYQDTRRASNWYNFPIASGPQFAHIRDNHTSHYVLSTYNQPSTLSLHTGDALSECVDNNPLSPMSSPYVEHGDCAFDRHYLQSCYGPQRSHTSSPYAALTFENIQNNYSDGYTPHTATCPSPKSVTTEHGSLECFVQSSSLTPVSTESVTIQHRNEPYPTTSSLYTSFHSATHSAYEYRHHTQSSQYLSHRAKFSCAQCQRGGQLVASWNICLLNHVTRRFCTQRESNTPYA